MFHTSRFPKSAFSMLAIMGTLLGMSACLPNDQRASNSSSSDDEAISKMETRLKDSARVNLIVSKLDRALGPVAGVLKDVENFLKADEKDEIRGKITEIERLSFSVVRQELDHMKRGLVNKNADGSWDVQETVKWPFDRDGSKSRNGMACDASVLSLEGDPIGSKAGEVNLTLSDCALSEPATLVRASVSENLEVDAELNLGDLEQLLDPGITKGTCSIKSSDIVGAQLECAPFRETSGNLVFDFEKVSYVGTSSGEIMDFALKISKIDSGTLKPIVRATVHKNVGQQFKVDIERL
jgi:hypothetical protein